MIPLNGTIIQISPTGNQTEIALYCMNICVYSILGQATLNTCTVLLSKENHKPQYCFTTTAKQTLNDHTKLFLILIFNL